MIILESTETSHTLLPAEIVITEVKRKRRRAHYTAYEARAVPSAGFVIKPWARGIVGYGRSREEAMNDLWNKATAAYLASEVVCTSVAKYVVNCAHTGTT